ncbi:MAG: hypothetical protein JW863_23230 [Chitinispirillaceae bacterium]|nr:hypothetical protein [Chitinispirillaceae bacterium]
MKTKNAPEKEVHPIVGTFLTGIPVILCIIGTVTCTSEKQSRTIEIKESELTVQVSCNGDSEKDNYLFSRSYRNAVVVDSFRRELPYPVYRFEVGDVDGNGIDDIAVGVIKPTRYDPEVNRRIFLFQLQEGSIIPLWLGSRVSQPLHDFTLIPASGRCNVRTIESEKDGSCLVAEYEWLGFGLSFVRYIKRNIPLKAAMKTVNKR